MPHDTPLIATIVVGLCLAFLFGAIANRLRISPLVGYLLAGVLCGPYTPGFVADQELTLQLAEIGVILLMFGVGLHFSVKELLSVKAIAVPGALAQIFAATALGTGLGLIIGWDLTGSVVFGLALSTASTVVLLRAMQERRLMETDRGRIAVGWLIVEDLVMVLTLVLMPAIAGLLHGNSGTVPSDPIASYLGLGITGIIVLTLIKIAVFIALMLIVGKRVVPWVLEVISASGSRELFRLGVLAIALGVAFGAANLFGVSLALGAFFAGMVMSESELSHQAAEESLPLRDAFAVLFFVSVGMLFDPMVLINNPLSLLATLLIIMIGKSAAAFFIVRAFKHPTGTALTISASLAQIGEFSFILAGLGVSLKIMPPEARDLVLAGAILSILCNPLVFIGFEKLRPFIERKLGAKQSADVTDLDADDKDSAADDFSTYATTQTGHTIIAGYGEVGSRVAARLIEEKRPLVVIENAEKPATELRETGVEVILGNAADADALARAGLADAQCLILALPYAFETARVIAQAGQINPSLHIIARAESVVEADYLRDLGIGTIILAEEEIARGILGKISETKTDYVKNLTETSPEEPLSSIN
ncbi:YbaL family putative K(+) efflux transporter [Pseudochrobactrum saccharolyticum]|uniref:CPA2 family monovalent cation:H+ antiporter-2 n=1 Tax=Pseudochrobactrum saccharolyticum TaxID=354352 RepID=A0A7W8AKA6_9HYPH|nr:YbaL family putative K(+) efflux transporter [Pseudochrobactrum saccharolyticum]KAB0537769.1 Kef family K(+) transporter [Pseudochrobactrum saccharolyticum]MBB5091835.1 CPA2 family monovalent cation:H+ antiporter-2 [Pseudochrobactrum saccharolyticum]MDP8250319.1 Kef family K(+) transporter [Pseudochrobactrum saccharolyticum]